MGELLNYACGKLELMENGIIIRQTHCILDWFHRLYYFLTLLMLLLKFFFEKFYGLIKSLC